MATYRSKILWWSQQDGHFFDPIHGNVCIGTLPILRQDITRLRVQVCKTTDFVLGSDLTAPAAAVVDISDYGNVYFGLKTNANYASGGDFAAIWSTYDTGDSAWHSTTSGRFTISVAPLSALALATYNSEFALLRSTTVEWRMGLTSSLYAPLVLGTEASAPAGSTTNSGIATITSPATYVDVTFTGMTATGVVVVCLLNTSDFTTLTVTPSAGKFRVTAGAVPDTSWTVGYLVVSK